MTKDKPIQQLKKIIKRDGREVPFEMKNVVRAISKAVAETGEFEEAEAKRLAGIVVTILTKANGTHIPTVEEVQDIVNHYYKDSETVLKTFNIDLGDKKSEKEADNVKKEQ